MALDLKRVNVETNDNIITNIKKIKEYLTETILDESDYMYLEILTDKIRFSKYKNKNELLNFINEIILKRRLKDNVYNNLEMLEILLEKNANLNGINIIKIGNYDYLTYNINGFGIIKFLHSDDLYNYVKGNIVTVLKSGKRDFIFNLRKFFEENLVAVKDDNQYIDELKAKFGLDYSYKTYKDEKGRYIFIIGDGLITINDDEINIIKSPSIEQVELPRLKENQYAL